MTFQPLDLVSAAPWRRVAFTTYALSLSFFEAVILDALVRGGGRDVTIFTDPEGIRSGISEQGARRPGREYDVLPIACTTGAFHPKLGIFLTDADCHLTVGSGNLTFGGWGVNLECTEHLHPSFAADAFDDAAEMLELLTADDRIRTGSEAQLLSLADDMRKRAAGAARRGNLRLLHNVGQEIGSEIAAIADELGGATALSVASPFFDADGRALARMADALALDHVSVHVHPRGPVAGTPGANWPALAKFEIRPVLVEDPLLVDGRQLHAKAIEVLCRRGRIVVSGSANATQAGLFTGNVEASVARIQRNTLMGWKRSACSAPPPDLRVASDEETENAARPGVLQASLEDDVLRGVVLVPKLSGVAQLHCIATSGEIELGQITLDASGNFSIAAPGLEPLGWSGNRLVLRIEQGTKTAEGFVSLVVASDITRRAGTHAARLFAMLNGSETPEDVAAILTWYHEDPSRMGTPVIGSSSNSEGTREVAPQFVTIAQLTESDAAMAGNKGTPSPSPGSGWERALSLVVAAFKQSRGPWSSAQEGSTRRGDEEDEPNTENETEDQAAKRREREEAARRRAANALETLLEAMLSPSHEGRHANTCFWLAHYVADRNRPEVAIARSWLRRIAHASRNLDPKGDAEFIEATLMLIAAEEGESAAAKARRHLLVRGVNPAELAISENETPGFAAVLPALDLSAFLADVTDCRTAGEQVQAFLEACDEAGPRDAFPLLRKSETWQLLSKALDDPASREKLFVYRQPPHACPGCNLQLARAHIEELLTIGVTRCCRTLLCTGESK